jgi:hypothetical protein
MEIIVMHRMEIVRVVLHITVFLVQVTALLPHILHTIIVHTTVILVIIIVLIIIIMDLQHTIEIISVLRMIMPAITTIITRPIPNIATLIIDIVRIQIIIVMIIRKIGP